MRPATHVRSALVMIGAVFAAAFSWSAAQGQIRPGGPGMRPPGMRPPTMRPPGFPNTGPRIVKIWTCSGCGKEIGRGLSVPPDTCPHCGARIINGVGGGITQPGIRGQNPQPNPNPGGPGFNPTPQANPPVFVDNNPQPNPPIVNPNPPANPPVALNPAPPVNPAPPPATTKRDDTSSSSLSSSSGSSGGSRNWKLITILVGVVTLGIAVLLGGTFLVIYVVKSSGSAGSGSRRPRRRDDYD